MVADGALHGLKMGYLWFDLTVLSMQPNLARAPRSLVQPPKSSLPTPSAEPIAPHQPGVERDIGGSDWVAPAPRPRYGAFLQREP